MDFSTISNQIGKMASYSHPLTKTAASGFGLATFASLSANWLLPAVQIRHFSHSKKVTVFLASLTTLFLTLYKTLNKESIKEEVKPPSAIPSKLDNTIEIAVKTPIETNKNEEIKPPSAIPSKLDNTIEIAVKTPIETNKNEEVKPEFEIIEYTEEETKKYLENSCEMQEAHRKMIRGADLERAPSLTRFVIKGTTLTILNYTDNKAWFTKDHYLKIDNSDSNKSFKLNCDLVVYKLMGEDRNIFIDFEDHKQKTRIYDYFEYTPEPLTSMILSKKWKYVHRLKKIPVFTELEACQKPTIYKISCINKKMTFKVMGEKDEEIHIQDVKLDDFKSNFNKKEISIQNLKFSCNQLYEIKSVTPEAEPFTYVDYTKQGLAILPFLLGNGMLDESIDKQLIKLTVYPTIVPNKYYRKINYVSYSNVPKEKIARVFESYKDQNIKYNKKRMSNTAVAKELIFRKSAKNYLLLQQLQEFYGFPKEILQALSVLYYQQCIKDSNID